MVDIASQLDRRNDTLKVEASSVTIIEDPPDTSKIPFGILFLGLFASTAIVVGGALAGAANETSSYRLWSVPTIPVEPRLALLPALLIFYGGLIVLVRSWLLLRRKHLTKKISLFALVVVIISWSFPLVLGPPLGSRDVYAYAAQGQAAEQGIDVYKSGPAAIGEDNIMLDSVDPLYHDSPVVYGPVFVSLSSWIVSVSGGNLVITIIMFRLFSILGLSITALAIFDLASKLNRDPIDALILAIANPVVLLHLVSGAHNESLMLAFLVSGVAVAQRKKFRRVGIALCAFAAAIKLPAILAVGFLGWSWGRPDESLGKRFLKLVVSGIEALIVIALVGQWTGWGWGWVDALMTAEPVDAYLSITRLLGGAFAWGTGFEAATVLQIARYLGLFVAAGFTLLLLFRKHATWPAALAWSLLLFAFLHPTTQPWYLTWGIMLYAACSAGERNRGMVSLCAVAAFVVMPIGPDLGVLVLANSGSFSILLGFAMLFFMTFSPKGHEATSYRTGLNANTVTVVVPTRNEEANISALVDQIYLNKSDTNLEVIFADDSDDSTFDAISNEIIKSRPLKNFSVRVLHRKMEDRWGGLSGAVVDALQIAKGTTVVVMDGDLQHPVEVISELALQIQRGSDVCIASRRIDGGSDHGLTKFRSFLSKATAIATKAIFPQRFSSVTDPMSGFFAFDLRKIDLNKLHPDGFKILVEIIGTHQNLDVSEIPYSFMGRVQGMSKASAAEGARFFGHLIDLRIRTGTLWAGAPVTQRVFRTETL